MSSIQVSLDEYYYFDFTVTCSDDSGVYEVAMDLDFAAYSNSFLEYGDIYNGEHLYSILFDMF
jgi:hypothetical protein